MSRGFRVDVSVLVLMLCHEKFGLLPNCMNQKYMPFLQYTQIELALGTERPVALIFLAKHSRCSYWGEANDAAQWDLFLNSTHF